MSRGSAPDMSSDNEYTYVIPNDGRLATSDILPLLAMHEVRVEYASGDRIGIKGTSDQRTFRELPNVDENFRGMIGTEQDVADWQQTHRDWFRIDAK
jgi:hypothetical protein